MGHGNQSLVSQAQPTCGVNSTVTRLRLRPPGAAPAGLLVWALHHSGMVLDTHLPLPSFQLTALSAPMETFLQRREPVDHVIGCPARYPSWVLMTGILVNMCVPGEFG